MDTIETLNSMFDNVLPKLIDCKGDATKMTSIMQDFKWSILCASASNPLNTEYIIDNIIPVEYIKER
jgi:hypothetical protein